MESVPATVKVRRTVRVAVVLLVGQALLCALIGWLTFGRSPAGPDGSATAGRLAVPPLVAPFSTGPPPPTPAPHRSARSSATTTPAEAATTSARFTTRPAQRSSAASRAAPAAPPAPPTSEPAAEPEIAPTTIPPAFIPPVPPTFPAVQEPVTVGDRCRPEWAFGRTADGTPVRCLRGWQHRLRWKIA